MQNKDVSYDVPDLEFEADKTGMIHVRKKQSKTEFLPGYGTTNFGMSAYDKIEKKSSKTALVGAGLIAAGVALILKDRIAQQLEAVSHYALLLREAAKDEISSLRS